MSWAAMRQDCGMQTWDAIRARRNVRQYTGQPIARDHLERICEAGRRAPSSQSWQPWHFVVVIGREQLAELAKVWQRGRQAHRWLGSDDRPVWPGRQKTSGTGTGCCMTSARRPRS